MVQTKNVEVEVSVEGNRCLDEIDINNSCRQVYLRRMESIEECKRSRPPIVTDEHASSVGAALARLRIEMVDLMDQDAGLMRQMLILNEKVEELKANNFCQMSKESLVSQDSLYYTDDQTDRLLSDEETFEYSQCTDNDSAYTDSDENSCNVISQTQDCFCSSEEFHDSDYLDCVFDKLLEFDTV